MKRAINLAQEAYCLHVFVQRNVTFKRRSRPFLNPVVDNVPNFSITFASDNHNFVAFAKAVGKYRHDTLSSPELGFCDYLKKFHI